MGRQPGADLVRRGFIRREQAPVAHRIGDPHERATVVAGVERLFPLAVLEGQHARPLNLKEEQILRPHPGQGLARRRGLDGGAVGIGLHRAVAGVSPGRRVADQRGVELAAIHGQEVRRPGPDRRPIGALAPMARGILRREIGREHALARQDLGPEVGLEPALRGFRVQGTDRPGAATGRRHGRVARNTACFAESRQRRGMIIRLPALKARKRYCPLNDDRLSGGTRQCRCRRSVGRRRARRVRSQGAAGRRCA